MSETSATLEVETERLIEALESIPSPSMRAGKRFLNVCRIKYVQMNHLNRHLSPVTSDMDTIFRIGVSIGHVLQTYQLEQESMQHYGDVNDQFDSNKSVQCAGSEILANTSLLTMTRQYKSQRASQARFVRSLNKILKQLDLSMSSDLRVNRTKPETPAAKLERESTISTISSRRESFASTTRSNRDTIFSSASSILAPSTKTTSIPKLAHLQTARIEKIESNIDLDIGFVHRTLFRVILRIYSALRDINDQRQWSPLESTIDDTESVFTALLLGPDDTFFYEEYVTAIHDITGRISGHLVEPFMRYMLNDVVEPRLEEDFGKLLEAL